MIDGVIYYPYINVPTTEWFTRVLLYWDEVGSIVPSDYVQHPEKLAAHMRDLVDVKLVKMVAPGQYIHEVPDFGTAFCDMIANDPDIMGRRGISLQRGETTRIHIEKFSPVAFDLCDMGLARGEINDFWFQVEKTTADLFMAYLAAVLGRCESLEMAPITDRAEHFSVFSSSPQKTASPSEVIDELRVSVLNGILPAPSLPVAARDLAEFKKKHHDLLLAFRRHIESSLTDMAGISDQFLRTRKLKSIEAGLKAAKDEVISKMHERRWPGIVFGTLCGLSAAAIPGARAVATGDMVSSLAALPGLIGAIYTAFKGIKEARQRMPRTPLAYAALAQDRFG
ncbi:MAG: DUF6236 family protein [Syntrophobacteraceae bacterium]